VTVEQNTEDWFSHICVSLSVCLLATSCGNHWLDPHENINQRCVCGQRTCKMGHFRQVISCIWTNQSDLCENFITDVSLDNEKSPLNFRSHLESGSGLWIQTAFTLAVCTLQNTLVVYLYVSVAVFYLDISWGNFPPMCLFFLQSALSQCMFCLLCTNRHPLTGC